MDNGKPDHNEAQAMLELCTSVGARAVDLTLTNSAGEKEWFRRNLPLVELRRMLPEKLDDATARKRNVNRERGAAARLWSRLMQSQHHLPGSSTSRAR